MAKAAFPLREDAGVKNTTSSRYSRRGYLTRRLLALTDTGSIILALMGTVAISDRAQSVQFIVWGLFTLPAWIALFKAYGLYDRDIKRISHFTLDDIPALLHAVLVGCLLTSLYYSVLPGREPVFVDILAFGAFALITIVVLRFLVRKLMTKVLGPERVLFIGDGKQTEVLVQKIRAHPEYGLEPIGVISSTLLPARSSAPVFGEIEGSTLSEMIARAEADRLVICNSHLSEETLLDLVHRCRGLSVKVSLLPQLFNAMGPSVEVDDVEGMTVLGINPPVLPRTSRYMKRSFDLFISVIALALLAPVMALIAFAIKLNSEGPVFFRQERVGKGGRMFYLLKFRTMVLGAEELTHELLSQSRDPAWLKLDRDPRITRVGRFLRRTSLDELPQLGNVVKGEMSLVGPRPLIESEDRKIKGWARSRLDLTPGLTGLWQVLGRTNIPFEEMIKLDYLYVMNWSLWTDIRLILRTLPAILTQRGAN